MGSRERAASLAGLMAAPLVIAIGLGVIYGRYGAVAAVAHGFAGLAAAASGLILATAVKVGTPLRGNRLGLVVAGVAFVAIAVVRLPLVPTMLVLAPVSVWLHRERVGVAG